MRTVVLDSGVTRYDMMGLSLTSSYIITISCIFADHPVMDCGRSNVRTSSPDVIIDSMEHFEAWLDEVSIHA